LHRWQFQRVLKLLSLLDIGITTTTVIIIIITIAARTFVKIAEL
jgi:hypothetical protein